METLKIFFSILREKKWLWGVIAGIITTTAIITYLVVGKNSKNQELNSFVPQFSPKEITNLDEKDENKLTILLLGYGGAGHQGGYLSDVIQVVHFDFEKKNTVLISIPRDLWVSLPNGTESKINGAYNQDMGNKNGEALISKSMASTVTGLPIDYYIAVDFVGFKRIIGEELGGIDVEVSEVLDDSWYPIKGEELNTCGKSPEEVAQLSSELFGFELERKFECRYKQVYFPVGVTHMEGGDALEFVRSRHGSAGGDFSRSKRQHEVLQAIKEKLFSLEGIDNIPAVFKEFSAHTQTDLDTKIAEYLWPILKETRKNKITTITLSTENVFINGKSSQGAYIVKPKESWSSVHSFINTQIKESISQ
ncbi:MAG: LCP family protein [Candidatus Pacebacteria bacterium]|jgi:polyisoprenyl-teichoic acid--peptidoglycan teichoic acid transferase|nr:LCP family protein [Candidatus Paceibacterota bacterium]MBT4652185.1 LCP family protein [Candidatus Paceibacterota bacterium]MBT6756616.1 LCP family protein [Candidatus Paceibacterota bacterium]MBT6920866.1 LCP family protein [Candidatus Paceibacterota bacterium]